MRLSLPFLLFLIQLVAGVIPAAAASPPEIRIVRIVGSAQVLRAGEWSKLAAQDTVSANERIRTPGGGEVFLDLGGVAAVRIGPDADLRVTSLAVTDAGRARPTVNSRLDLGKGRAWINVKELSRNSRFEVRTPVIVAGVRGTSFAVGADGPFAGVGVAAGSVDMGPAPDASDFPDAAALPSRFTPLLLGVREQALIGTGDPVREAIPDEEWNLLKQALQELVNTVEMSRMKRLLDQIPRKEDASLLRLTSAFRALFILKQVIDRANARLAEVESEFGENRSYWQEAASLDLLREQTVGAVSEARLRYETAYEKLAGSTIRQIEKIVERYDAFAARARFSEIAGDTVSGRIRAPEEVIPVTPDLSTPVDPFAASEIAEFVKRTLEQFFVALETEKIGDVEARVAESFFNNDRNQFRYGRNDFLISVQKDFDHLDNVAYRLRVKSIEFSGNHAIVRLLWDRRATIATTRSEWLVKDQSSILTFERSDGDRRFLLSRIDGDPITGLSSSYSGVTLVKDGTLDNVRLDTAIAIDDDQRKDTADADDFPDVPPTEIGLTPPATGAVTYTLNADTVIGAGQTWTLNSGDQVRIGAGVRITVANGGVLNAHGATFTNQGGGNWNGLFFSNTGGANSLLNCTIQNADTGIHLSSVTAISISSCQVTVTGDAIVSENSTSTIQSNTIRGTQRGVRLRGTGTVTMSSNTVQNSTGVAALSIEMAAPFTGTLTSTSDFFTVSRMGALFVEGGPGTYQFTSTSFTQNTLDGVNVQMAMGTSYTFTGCQINQNTRHGIWNVGGATMTVSSSNIMQNTDTGIRGGGVATMNDCYLSGNNGAAGVDLSTAIPNSGSAPPQYAEMNTVTNPSATPK